MTAPGGAPHGAAVLNLSLNGRGVPRRAGFTPKLSAAADPTQRGPNLGPTQLAGAHARRAHTKPTAQVHAYDSPCLAGRRSGDEGVASSNLASPTVFGLVSGVFRSAGPLFTSAPARPRRALSLERMRSATWCLRRGPRGLEGLPLD